MLTQVSLCRAEQMLCALSISQCAHIFGSSVLQLDYEPSKGCVLRRTHPTYVVGKASGLSLLWLVTLGANRILDHKMSLLSQLQRKQWGSHSCILTSWMLSGTDRGMHPFAASGSGGKGSVGRQQDSKRKVPDRVSQWLLSFCLPCEMR